MSEIINDEHQADEFTEACRKLGEACQLLYEALRTVLEQVAEAIREVVEAFTRWLFEIRLRNIGVPQKMAEWTAWRWPWRWMPKKWVYSFIRAPD